MDKKIFNTDQAPAAVGPYSHAVETHGLLFCSGQIPLDAKTGEVLKGSVSEQADLALKNVKALLEARGLTLSHVVKTTCFLTDMSKFQEFNEVYSKFFNEGKPARSCVAAKELPKGVDVEVEVIATID